MQAQNIKSNFEAVFSSWLGIAKKNVQPQEVANINKIAHKCFERRESELDVTKILPGMHPTTVEHAKINYHAAFLVVTSSLDHLINQWHEVKNVAQRAALLRAVIAANPNHITDDMLFKFLTSIKIEADSGWFIDNGNITPAYHALISNRPSRRTGESRTPKQFYDEYQAAAAAWVVPKAKDQELVSKPFVTNITTATSTTITTITPNEVQSAASVSKIEALAASEPLETIFLPIFLSSQSYRADFLDVIQFTASILKGDYAAVEQQIKQTVCNMSKENKYWAGTSPEEAKSFINTWYKYSYCPFIVEVQVSEKSLQKYSDHRVISNITNPQAVTFIDVKVTDDVQISVGSEDCYTLASPELLNTITPKEGHKEGYLYRDADGKPRATLVYNHLMREELDPSDLDLRPIYHKALANLIMPSQGIKQESGGGQMGMRTGAVIISMASSKLESAVHLFKLHVKLQQVRRIEAEKNESSVAEAVEILRSCIKDMNVQLIAYERPLLVAKMLKLMQHDLLAMRQEANTLLLLKGHLDPASPFHTLPKELVSILIKKGLEIELENINELLKAKA